MSLKNFKEVKLDNFQEERGPPPHSTLAYVDDVIISFLFYNLPHTLQDFSHCFFTYCELQNPLAANVEQFLA
jgi:hypothetical protein